MQVGGQTKRKLLAPICICTWSGLNETQGNISIIISCNTAQHSTVARPKLHKTTGNVKKRSKAKFNLQYDDHPAGPTTRDCLGTCTSRSSCGTASSDYSHGRMYYKPVPRSDPRCEWANTCSAAMNITLCQP